MKNFFPIRAVVLGILLSAASAALLLQSSPALADGSFSEGLKLYHQGHYEKALRIFKDLHDHQPSGSGKFQYFMALAEHHQGLEHPALMDLEGAIHTNPSLSFARNPGHVRSLHDRLVKAVEEGQSPLPAPHPTLFSPSRSEGSSHLPMLLLLLAVGGGLIFWALKKREKTQQSSLSKDKQEMEETAERLMKAVDKLLEDKNYYLLDHPDRKTAVEAAFHALDPAYRNALSILREPETPQTNWSERRNRFEAALEPVDQAILSIKNLLGETPPPPPSAAASSPGAEGGSPPPPPDAAPIGGDRCVFCGRDAREGRTVPLERQGKVAYARACPTCLAEMDQHYQQTGQYQPPASFYSGGMPYMGGGLSFGDLMLLDWMTHEGHSDSPPVSMPESHAQGDWGGGGGFGREDREGGDHGGGDRS
ncbi:MAG: hypothetical protein M1509_00100 [Nitrospirae bacterium]|nr:hypothetical protein [Nitrospirota bacterium]